MSKPLYAVTGDVRHRRAARDIETLKNRSASRLVIWGSDDPLAPAFENGWDHRGDPYQDFGFRLVLGGGFELVGSPSGGTLGTSCGTLPQILVVHLSGQIPAHFVDDDGVPIGGWIQPDGQVVVGLA